MQRVKSLVWSNFLFLVKRPYYLWLLLHILEAAKLAHMFDNQSIIFNSFWKLVTTLLES